MKIIKKNKIKLQLQGFERLCNKDFCLLSVSGCTPAHLQLHLHNGCLFTLLDSSLPREQQQLCNYRIAIRPTTFTCLSVRFLVTAG